MRIVGRETITAFMAKHARSSKQLSAWLAEAERSKWKTPLQIKKRYRSADFLSDNRVIFDIAGNNYRLVVKIAYQVGIVQVQWIGTHAEYDRKKF